MPLLDGVPIVGCVRQLEQALGDRALLQVTSYKVTKLQSYKVTKLQATGTVCLARDVLSGGTP